MSTNYFLGDKIMKKVIVVVEHHSGTDDKISVYDYQENTIKILEEEKTL